MARSVKKRATKNFGRKMRKNTLKNIKRMLKNNEVIQRLKLNKE